MKLSESKLKLALGDRAGEVVPVLFDEVDSTNAEAKRRVLSGDVSATPVLLAADRQTAGRGRMGRAFFSPGESGAYFSILFEARGPIGNTLPVTCAAAVAVARAIRHLTGVFPQIKWVNDLLIDGKKVCGILTEAMTCGDRAWVIIGIGVNLTTADFPDALREIAGNVGNVARESLIGAVVRELYPFLCDASDRTWLPDYRAHSCLIGKRITWQSGDTVCTGVALGVDGDGGLTVRSDDGKEQILRTGEVTVRIVKN